MEQERSLSCFDIAEQMQEVDVGETKAKTQPLRATKTLALQRAHVVMQDENGYEYLAECRWRKSDAAPSGINAALFEIELSSVEKFLPCTLPTSIEHTAQCLPRSWWNLMAKAAASAAEGAPDDIVQLRTVVAYTSVDMARTEWVERCFIECEGVTAAACTVRTGQRVEAIKNKQDSHSLEDLIKHAFCVLLIDNSCDLKKADAQIARSLVWRWLPESVEFFGARL